MMIHALLIRYNHVEFCVLKFVLCYVYGTDRVELDDTAGKNDHLPIKLTSQQIVRLIIIVISIIIIIIIIVALGSKDPEG